MLDGAFIDYANLTAVGSNGPGIGAGSSPSAFGISIVSAVVISSSIVSASSNSSAGIGSGAGATSGLGTLDLVTGPVNVSGSPGIGGNVRSLNFGPGDVVLVHCKSSREYCVNAQYLSITSVKVRFTVDGPRVFSNASAASAIGTSDFFAQYATDSKPEGLKAGNWLHLTNLPAFAAGNSRLAFHHSGGHITVVRFEEIGMRGCLVALPESGKYQVNVLDGNGKSGGNLCHGDSSSFQVGGGEAVFADVSICKVNVGLIVGLSVAGLLFVVLVYVGIIVFLKCRRKRKLEKPPPERKQAVNPETLVSAGDAQLDMPMYV
jgi:hypothetical protein